ncbi:MAG TPA: hypothetical protein VGN12_27300 [Pirellulales bacterium]
MIRAALPLSSLSIFRREKGAAPELYGPAAGLIPYDYSVVEPAAKVTSAFGASTIDPAATVCRLNTPVLRMESGSPSHHESPLNCPSDRA